MVIQGSLVQASVWLCIFLTQDIWWPGCAFFFTCVTMNPKVYSKLILYISMCILVKVQLAIGNWHTPKLFISLVLKFEKVHLTLYPLVVNFIVRWYPLQTVWTQIRPDKTSGLIWIQTVWHSDGISERFFEKVNLKKKKIHKWQKSMQNYPTQKKLTTFSCD